MSDVIEIGYNLQVKAPCGYGGEVSRRSGPPASPLQDLRVIS